MVLSWNEIKKRAIAFSKKWVDATDENAEAKSFLVDFFNVFGVSDRRVKKFEEYKVPKRSEVGAMPILICYGTAISLSTTSNHKNYHLKGSQEYGLLDRTRDKGGVLYI